MSIILGLWSIQDDRMLAAKVRERAQRTDRYALDGTYVIANGNVGMACQPLRTTDRASKEGSPIVDGVGNTLALDGRIDNYEELADSLGISSSSTDSVLVLAGFRRWGQSLFSRLIGDWALSLWSPTISTLFLARDHAGTRSLYFRRASGEVEWSTYLESFFVEANLPELDEGFVASYLCASPLGSLTPYEGIHAVKPAHFVAINGQRMTESAHWDPMCSGQLKLRSDADYQDEFLFRFGTSVTRRTGPGAHVSAQLSGGRDSTGIVCMSDRMRRSGNPDADLLDTLSFYDDHEASWNERPYFSLIEARRGKVGIHHDMSHESFTFVPPDPPYATDYFPGYTKGTLNAEQDLEDELRIKDYRVILSGIGGDEVLGGVPTPMPELANYLVSHRFGRLARQGLAWSLSNKRSLVDVLLSTYRYKQKLYGKVPRPRRMPPPWIGPSLRPAWSKIESDLETTPNQDKFLPSALENGRAWWSILETLPHRFPGFLRRREYRYPYLDRNLVEFLFQVPREQLLRPGDHRSMMRRALRGIVPDEILDRPRKANLSRSPIVLLRRERENILSMFASSRAEAIGYIDGAVFKGCLSQLLDGTDTSHALAIRKTIDLEILLRTRDSYKFYRSGIPEQQLCSVNQEQPSSV